MTDSGWRDPFTDDDAAQERERRRREREESRKHRGESTRKSLGDRVREQLGGASSSPKPPAEPPPTPAADPPPPPPVPPVSPPASTDPPSEVDLPPIPESAPAEFEHTDSHPLPEISIPVQRKLRSRASHLKRRRLFGLAGMLVLIACVTAAAVVISRRDHKDALDAPPPRKTFEVVVPEGTSLADIAPLAKQAGVHGSYKKAAKKALHNRKLINLKKYGAQKAKNLEGFLYPATYDLFKNAKAPALVAKQLAAFEEEFRGIDLKFAKAKNLTPYDVVIIASMIEREVQVPRERKLVSSVIYNRLKRGIPLGIDATIRYEDSNFTKSLLASRLQADTPYNTRVNAGLPPGPIGNPGLASLKAAAHPAKTDYLFYVVKPGECGKSVFSKTDAQAQRAVAKYHAAREAAGGKSPTKC